MSEHGKEDSSRTTAARGKFRPPSSSSNASTSASDSREADFDDVTDSEDEDPSFMPSDFDLNRSSSSSAATYYNNLSSGEEPDPAYAKLEQKMYKSFLVDDEEGDSDSVDEGWSVTSEDESSSCSLTSSSDSGENAVAGGGVAAPRGPSPDPGSSSPMATPSTSTGITHGGSHKFAHGYKARMVSRWSDLTFRQRQQQRTATTIEDLILSSDTATSDTDCRLSTDSSEATGKRKRSRQGKSGKTLGKSGKKSACKRQKKKK
jgi:hypothetical protein